MRIFFDIHAWYLSKLWLADPAAKQWKHNRCDDGHLLSNEDIQDYAVYIFYNRIKENSAKVGSCSHKNNTFRAKKSGQLI